MRQVAHHDYDRRADAADAARWHGDENRGRRGAGAAGRQTNAREAGPSEGRPRVDERVASLGVLHAAVVLHIEFGFVGRKLLHDGSARRG